MQEEDERRLQKIEAILASVAASQAAAAERANRADVRMDRAEARMDRAEARMDRMDARSQQLEAGFEKRMRGFEKLAKIGMKEIVELRRLQRETDHKLNALIDSQQRTEATLRAFMESLRRGGNGHNGGRTR
jgi:division protein CdvB (Snf7/Vps24/ESCRT-III family)